MTLPNGRVKGMKTNGYFLLDLTKLLSASARISRRATNPKVIHF